MGEFFKPWRRKAGCVTLLIAVVFMAGWVRSSFVKDHLTRRDGLGNSIQAISFDSHFGLVVRKGFSKTGGPEIRLRQSAVESIHGFAAERDGWRWYWLGLGMVDNKWVGGYLKAWFAHYGSIAIPLTLLSAWLLLSTPPQTKQVKTSGPPNERA